MKKCSINKLVTIIVLVCVLVASLVPALFITDVYADGSYIIIMESYQPDKMEQSELDKILKMAARQEEFDSWAEKEWTKYNTDPETIVKSQTAALNEFNKALPKIQKLIKDARDGGDFDTAALIQDSVSIVSGIVANIPPYGPVIAAAINIVHTIFSTCMGGEDPPSASALMEDHINQEFAKLSNEIAALEEDIRVLSDKVDESTNKIINSMYNAFDMAEAKEAINKFYYLEGQDDFSYQQYRNYIYGTKTANSNATTAYNSLLVYAQLNGAPAEEIKYYYDMLYSSLVNNREAFQQAVLSGQTKKSIVRYYYDVLLAHPEYIKDLGISPELATIQFAYELYQTYIFAEELMLACNNYQYTQMALNGTGSYEYGTGTIFKRDIEGTKDEDGNIIEEPIIYNQFLTTAEVLKKQLAEDIAYVIGANSTFAMESDGKLYALYTENDDGTVYGKVQPNSTVYLNNVPASICELFDIEYTDYEYDIVGVDTESASNKDGMIEITSGDVIVSLTYRGEPVSTICLTCDTNTTQFSGGTGTIEDPYLISTAEEFLKIKDGMDKYYRLITDIDFSGVTEPVYPLGRKVMGNESIAYDEFNGIIDGNGYTLSNLTIELSKYSVQSLKYSVQSEDYLGIIGIIGGDGVVKNLTFQDVNVTTTIDEVEFSESQLYAGIIAGHNKGNIRNCHITSTKGTAYVNLTSTTTNEGAERSVYSYVGGITGKNEGLIQFVSVSQINISASTTHDFAGADVEKNKNLVYVGGVCGYNARHIMCAVVESSTSIVAEAEATFNPKSTVSPYVTALAGGITGVDNDANLNYIKFVYSEATATGTGKLNAESGWGKLGDRGKNIIEGGNAYIPKVEDYPEDFKEEKDVIIAAFPNVAKLTVDCEDKTTAYNIGDQSPNLDNLSLTIDGDTFEYVVLEVYGFDTTAVTDAQNVTMLILATIGDKQQLLTTEFNTKVEDCIVDITVKGILSEYELKECLPDTVTVVEHYAVGTPVEFIEDFDIENKSQITSQYGVHEVVFSYKGIEKIITINVPCPHLDNSDYSNTELYELINTVPSTCQVIGYDMYRCKKCGLEFETNYKPMTDHKITEVEAERATCQKEGSTDSVYCEYGCGVEFGGEVIPMIPHSIVEKGDTSWPDNQPNENEHFCTSCDRWLSHNYIITESSEETGIVYTLTCQDCKYVSTITDSNIITVEDKGHPAVIVSDGYALNAGDLVTVYVQLVNNPVVTGAQFGVRYDERLTLVEWSDGRLFEKIFNNTDGVFNVANAKPTKTSCGYNFLWEVGSAKDEEGKPVAPDGNLLKLVFKLPDDATTVERYTVSVVYTSKNGSIGGFNLDGVYDVNARKQFITKEGVIRLVEEGDRLPGDINGDRCVDIMDVVIFANYILDEDFDLDVIKQYADVNLDNSINSGDLKRILLSLTGGHGDAGNLLYHKYQLALNTNGYDTTDVPKHIEVDLYTDTYASILADFEDIMCSRPEYKFLGWYTRMDCTCCTCTEKNCVCKGNCSGNNACTCDCTRKYHCEHFVSCACEVENCTHKIVYDPLQKIQTLYARWEKNEIIWDGYEGYDFLNDDYTFKAPEEEFYYITLYSTHDDKNTGRGRLVHEFQYWYYIDDNNKEHKYYANDINSTLNINQQQTGKITLKAAWEWVLEVDELPDIVGYKVESVVWYLQEGPINEYSAEKYDQLIDSKELYGKWKSPIEYTVSVNLDGGTVNFDGNTRQESFSADGTYGEVFALENPKRTGYTFTGWTITGMDDGSHLYWSSDIKDWMSNKNTSWTDRMETQFKNLHSTDGETVTFTAQWNVNSYTVSVSLGYDGAPAQNNIETTYDDEPFPLENPTREGHIFKGWKITGMDDCTHWFYDDEMPDGYSSNSTELSDICATSFMNLRSTEGVVHFEAQWFYLITYKYDQNSGLTVTSDGEELFGDFQLEGCPEKITYNSTTPLGAALPTVDYEKYYEFIGWAIINSAGEYVLITNSEGNLLATDGYITSNGEWCITESFTVYARYKQKICVQYVANENITKLNFNGSRSTYLVIEDIDLGGAKWTSIETFLGVLDGDGHKIHNFRIEETSNDYDYKIEESGTNFAPVGFVRTNSGIIMDLIIGCETDNDNSYTVNGSKYSVKYDIRYSEKVKEEYTRLSVGGIAGENKGTIVNCRVVNVYIYSELSDTDNDGNAYLNLGGIAGVNFGDIINSMVNDSYTGGYMPVASDSGDNNIGHLGGITALNANKIEFCLVEDCTFLLDVRGDGCPVFLGKNMAYPQATVGGIVADQDSSIDLSKCISYNNAIGIHCSKGDYTEPTVKVGTIVGALTTAQITSCYAIYPTDATPITTTLGNGDPKYTNSILGEGESEGCIAISDKNELSDDMKYLLSDETDNGLNYFLKSDGTYEVIRIPYDQGSNYELVIPSTFNEIPVTSIGSSAFLWCTSLTSITIPSSVTSISSSAFLWCTSLTTVTFEQGSQLISIGDDAFSNCYSLTSITIPSSVTSIGTGAFSNCYSLTTVILEEGSQLISINDDGFSNCYSLTNITIPDSVTSIGNSAFDCCTSLVSVTLSEDSRLTSIGSDAFSNCYSLTNITIPSSVTSIGTGAFYACYNLTTVVFERDSQLESIVWAAFGECTNLTSITIPNSVTSIGSSAFYGCNDLTNITIPSSVTSIGSSAFSSCDALTSVIFEGDSKLESIGSSAFSSCDALTSITIPSSVTSIDSWAFSSCDALTSITIPSSVTSIGDCVFLFSDNLTSVYYTGTEEQWNNISIGDDNEYLTNATITYNYKSESN